MRTGNPKEKSAFQNYDIDNIIRPLLNAMEKLNEINPSLANLREKHTHKKLDRLPFAEETSIPLLHSVGPKIPQYNTGQSKNELSAPPVAVAVPMAEVEAVAVAQSGQTFLNSDPIGNLFKQLDDAMSQASTQTPMTLGPPKDAINYLKAILPKINYLDKKGDYFKHLLCHLHFWKNNSGLPKILIEAVKETEAILNKIIINNEELKDLATIKTSLTKVHLETKQKSLIVTDETNDNNSHQQQCGFFRPSFTNTLMRDLNRAFDEVNGLHSEDTNIIATFRTSIKTDIVRIANLVPIILGKPIMALQFIEENLTDGSVESIKTLLRQFQYWLSQPHLPKSLKDLLEKIELKIFEHTQLKVGGVDYNDEQRAEIADYRQMLVYNLAQTQKVQDSSFSKQHRNIATITKTALLERNNTRFTFAGTVFCCCTDITMKSNGGHDMVP